MAKILLAEDDAALNHLVCTLLEGAGHEVVACKDGGAALEEFHRQSFDLLITDIMMPVLDGYRLTALVQNVLRLNRLEHHGIRAEFTSLRLDELLARCILAFEEQMEQKGLELSCELAEVTVRSDESCLEIVWNNLLSNAVKFTSEGTISVTLRREGDNAVVTVSDTGCGMSAETGRHIFEKFYQGDTSHAAEGNGLGLALVRQVIDLLGGEIAVESAPQKGSTFRVTLYGACV